MFPQIQGFNAQSITPNDDDDITLGGLAIGINQNGVALFIGTGGDVKVDMVGAGAAITFVNVPNGTFLPIQVKKVYDSDTSAMNIVAVY